MKQRQNKCYENGKGFNLPVGWEDKELFSEELIFKLQLVGGHKIPSYWIEFKN